MFFSIHDYVDNLNNFCSMLAHIPCLCPSSPFIGNFGIIYRFVLSQFSIFNLEGVCVFKVQTSQLALIESDVYLFHPHICMTDASFGHCICQFSGREQTRWSSSNIDDLRH